ncbi:hypothetical protein O181_090842 [Austropuccinia psidii MF-1]|uniref:Uncharacterized protein n=1 Tax=Austropuccinia psidii MF-1 TaxID=1389203 RepID=A0A9Q3IW50_9BASI|nr:hypothetical protein [Austropuccinia psidii MF-1]
MLVQVPNTSHTNSYAQYFTCNSLSLARLPTLHMQCLTLVQVPNSSHASPYAQCLTWASHAIPYAQRFTQDSLHWSRLSTPTHQSLGPKVHTQFLMLVQLPDASHASPYAGPSSQRLTGKSLSPMLHTQFLMTLRLIVGDVRTGSDSCI